MGWYHEIPQLYPVIWGFFTTYELAHPRMEQVQPATPSGQDILCWRRRVKVLGDPKVKPRHNSSQHGPCRSEADDGAGRTRKRTRVLFIVIMNMIVSTVTTFIFVNDCYSSFTIPVIMLTAVIMVLIMILIMMLIMMLMLILILMPLVMLMLVRASGDDDPLNFLLDPGRMSAFLFLRLRDSSKFISSR